MLVTAALRESIHKTFIQRTIHAVSSGCARSELNCPHYRLTSLEFSVVSSELLVSSPFSSGFRVHFNINQ